MAAVSEVPLVLLSALAGLAPCPGEGARRTGVSVNGTTLGPGFVRPEGKKGAAKSAQSTVLT